MSKDKSGSDLITDVEVITLDFCIALLERLPIKMALEAMKEQRAKKLSN